MGKLVTVDSDDLEAMLMAKAAIKGVESALAVAKNDVFVQRVAPRFAAAHDEIARQWRRDNLPKGRKIS
jgi:hypothetical protein